VARLDAVRSLLLEAKTASVKFPDCTEVIKANAGDTGYYQVSYEPALFQKLKSLYERMPVADRLNFLNDAWAMVEAGRASATNYLGLAESIRSETTYAIWSQIVSALDLVDELQRQQPGHRAYEQWACRLLRPQLDRLGWEPRAGEPDTDALLRSLVITRLGDFGDAAVIAEARTRSEKFLAAPATLPADLRPVVFTIVGRYSDKATYEQIHALARQAKGSEERQLYYHALAGALDPKLAEATLELSLTDELVPQEATALVIEVARQGEQPELAWQFFQRHAKALLAKVDAFERNNYVPWLFSSFSDAPRADELETYIASHFPKEALAKARETAETIRFKAALKQRDLPVIDAWVSSRRSS
jgi:aminopeptidase N